jgi:hypothetical protein
MFYGILTALGGLLAASAFFVAKKPNAKVLIDKLTPYQGWIGVVLLFWGLWLGLHTIRLLGSGISILWLVTWAAMAVVNTGVGFLLGFGLVTKYALSKNEVAMQKGQQIRQRLVNVQIPLGIAAVAVGVWQALYVLLA